MRAKADLEEFYSKLADEAKAGLERNNLCPTFHVFKHMQGGPNQESHEAPITKLDGSTCRSTKETLDRWHEYYSGMLNHMAATPALISMTRRQRLPYHRHPDRCTNAVRSHEGHKNTEERQSSRRHHSRTLYMRWSPPSARPSTSCSWKSGEQEGCPVNGETVSSSPSTKVKGFAANAAATDQLNCCRSPGKCSDTSYWTASSPFSCVSVVPSSRDSPDDENDNGGHSDPPFACGESPGVWQTTTCSLHQHQGGICLGRPWVSVESLESSGHTTLPTPPDKGSSWGHNITRSHSRWRRLWPIPNIFGCMSGLHTSPIVILLCYRLDLE